MKEATVARVAAGDKVALKTRAQARIVATMAADSPLDQAAAMARTTTSLAAAISSGKTPDLTRTRASKWAATTRTKAVTPGTRATAQETRVDKVVTTMDSHLAGTKAMVLTGTRATRIKATKIVVVLRAGEVLLTRDSLADMARAPVTASMDHRTKVQIL